MRKLLEMNNSKMSAKENCEWNEKFSPQKMEKKE